MENYLYTSNHIGILKKYRSFKVIFLLLGCLVLLLQSISWLVVWNRDMAVSTSDKVFVTFTLMGAFSFIISQAYFIARNNKIMKIVKSGDNFQTRRITIKFSNKSSIGGAFVVFCRIIALVLVMLMGVMIASFVQNYLNWGKIILKMPFMVLIVVQILNLSAELKYQTMVEKAKV